MSTYAIKTFHTDLERIKHFGGTNKETAIRFAFQKLLDEYAKAKDLMLIPEVSLKTKSGKTVTPDGTLKDVLRLDHGYWESKDEADDIDEEIKKKFAKSYPSDNILFEDSGTAVLIQHGQEVMRTAMTDEAALDKLLTRFVGFERPEITDFRKAIDKFREDIPKVTETLHAIIQAQDKTNPAYVKAAKDFHELCKQSINPDISEADIKEMMVQHILSADIFNTIFDEPHFHQENNIARELNKVIDTFFTGATRRTTLAAIQHYYQTINAAAAGIADHHEKQMFLKVVYENFYKAYNPKAADRLGIVYTPNEIVQFMIKSTDYLLHKHFGKTLADKNVEILDPATGTGTFICDIIDFLPKNKVAYKYKNELHANELAILPYYIANLNIEYTYKQKTGEYAEFENLCLVDTLDNTGFNWVGKQGDLFGVSAENAQRIKKQNERKISVIIGNPPYNANQEDENDNNKNRHYKEIDQRIKTTFVKFSKAQKTKVYDMYSRFYRWAMDRLIGEGLITFITNNSFLTAQGFDGFRKVLDNDFSDIYIIDLAGDLRNDKEGNIFGIKVGVCITYCVKSKLKHQPCQIHYFKLPERAADKKIKYLTSLDFKRIEFDRLSPDGSNNWLNNAENDFDSLIPLISKGKKDSLFSKHSNGLSSNRDEWVYDFDIDNLIKKTNYFIDEYNSEVDRWLKYKKENKYVDIRDESNPVVDNFLHSRNLIKWSKMIKRDKLRKGKKDQFNEDGLRNCCYRPFVKKFLYFGYTGIDIKGAFPGFYPNKISENVTISISTGPRVLFCSLASKEITDLNLLNPSPVTSFARHYYDSNGNCLDNITDWGLEQFTTHYKDSLRQAQANITKEDIFHYVYAVLHHPAYRKKYELNLKREFPRLPFYDNFWQWAKWGKELMQWHIEYEKAAPYPLKLVTLSLSKGDVPKPKLKADKVAGIIILDEVTELHGIPAAAWEYKLGNRSALEWILDQYKESKPKDPTIAEKFNTYKFADYKEQVIDLLVRVCTVSVETMKIVKAMPE